MPEPSFLELRNVFKSFGAHTVLRDVSFDVRRGEAVCILGRSGVGKSVMLKLAMGFLRADSGQVILDGVDVGRLSESELTEMHKKVTMVFQSGALFDSLTVEENIAFPLRERGNSVSTADLDAEVEHVLDLLDLKPMRNVYPASLSTGMKRAVAIARALAAHPQAILYDEPTTMVDPMMSHLIGALIAKVQRQVRLTSVVVTHDTQLARKLADRLVFLHEGGVRFFGTLAEMETSTDPELREFLRHDSLALT